MYHGASMIPWYGTRCLQCLQTAVPLESEPNAQDLKQVEQLSECCHGG